MQPAIESSALSPSVSRVILYVKNIEKVAAFYEEIFGMRRIPSRGTGWLELESPSGGCRVALHQAAKGQKSGAAVKLVFGVLDVVAFAAAAQAKGLKFGSLHVVRGDPGHEFANAKDPAGNSISISSRGMRTAPGAVSQGSEIGA
jgi:catechol 2,3-dioxygenase-like lactoylglutathione lyase family enzyme